MTYRFFFFLPLVVVACSSSSGSDPASSPDRTASPTTPPPSLESACDHYARAQQARDQRCSGLEPNPAQPLAVQTEFCLSYYRLPGLAVSSTDVESCAAALESTACGVVEISACKPGAGKLVVGDACEDPEQCASGFCDLHQQVDGTFPQCGTCQPSLAEGAACDRLASLFDPCAKGTVCGAGKCVKPVPFGGACTRGDDAVFCERGKCIDGTCQDDRPVGGACSRDGDCVFGLVCVTGICRNPTYKNPGETCSGPGEACATGFCWGGDDAHPATCPKVLALGDACDERDTTATCPVDAWCQHGKCAALGDHVCR